MIKTFAGRHFAVVLIFLLQTWGILSVTHIYAAFVTKFVSEGNVVEMRKCEVFACLWLFSVIPVGRDAVLASVLRADRDISWLALRIVQTQNIKHLIFILPWLLLF